MHSQLSESLRVSSDDDSRAFREIINQCFVNVTQAQFEGTEGHRCSEVGGELLKQTQSRMAERNTSTNRLQVRSISSEKGFDSSGVK